MCVLLVEDEPLILECMAESLVDAGLDVTTASDGRTAISLIEGEGPRFSALVTDLHLPGRVDGMQVVECMRARHPGVPVVVATARQELLTPEWRGRTGVQVLTKPYSMAALVCVVQQLLSLVPCNTIGTD